MHERRTEQGYKLRVYLDALQEAKNTSDEQWIQNWISDPLSPAYLPRTAWIAYLEHCIVVESERYFEIERNVA